MFRIIKEGDVFATKEVCATSGPRCAVLEDGSVLCTFMINSKSGANDFVTMAAYSDGELSFGEAKAVWPHLKGKESLFGSVRKGGDGNYYIAGQAFPIAYEGEAFWSDEAMGMKENRVFFAKSEDGKSFADPEMVALPFYASAEQPGGMLCDGDGTLTMIYSPYPTIEKREEVDNECMVLLRSRDGGKTFSGKKFAMIGEDSQYAESWITRLTDGRLMVSTWQTASENSSQYLISDDDGETFKGPFAQEFKGQSTGICAWEDGSVLIAYNQRKYGTVGVWLAMECFDGEGKAILLENQPVWEAETATKTGDSTDFGQWTDFSFGEPSVTVLPDNTLLVTLWYQKGDVAGIRYVQLEREM
ncbi:MAG: exo-alpha-sialidase [Ruminococcaceae bacterium]|nr:exo-alpha-sialidase [Oscillospiraceae bacterium]